MDHHQAPAEMTLSEAHRKVIYLMDNLGEFEKIEIRYQAGRLIIVSSHTTKEDYPAPKRGILPTKP